MSQKTEKIYLTVYGVKNCYPTYGEGGNVVHLTGEIPINGDNKSSSPFLTSPLFSVPSDGYENVPDLIGKWSVSFLISSNPITVVKSLKHALTASGRKDTSMWFSLGLSNIIVFEKLLGETNDFIAKSIIDDPSYSQFIPAWEYWLVEDSCIMNSQTSGEPEEKDRVFISVDFPKNLNEFPSDTQFAVTEYLISAQKIVDAALKYTPQYHRDFVKIFNAANLLLNDLLGLISDDLSKVRPRVKALVDKGYSKQQLINDKHGRLTQLNSALSYVYNQSYSGSLPILEHFGIIRRFSLLGVGGGINALFELVGQLEELFVQLSFEEIIESGTYDQKKIGFKYTPSLIDDDYNKSIFELDFERKKLIGEISPDQYQSLEDPDFFKRFAFFSGRLGFREYDFSATSAIQVLIDGKQLRWNVINYTHELIHNHVRIILNKLLRTGYFDHGSDASKSYVVFLTEVRKRLFSWMRGKHSEELTYSEFFRLMLLRYCIMSRYAGSLTTEFKQKIWDKAEKENRKFKLVMPDAEEIGQLILDEYKGISEIFVHVVDFSYIYRKDVDTYVESIWCSWSTVGVVAHDLPQYVLRTLLVLSQTLTGTGAQRYEKSVRDLNVILDRLMKNHPGITVFRTVKENVLSSAEAGKIGLKPRFLNCLPIADIAGQFFVADIERYLNRGDKKAGVSKQENAYKIDFGIIDSESPNVHSKVRFALGQLQHTIDNLESTNFSERATAWLLLNLSSHNHD